MPEIIELATEELPENCFVFKHSTRCPVSFAAADEVRAASLSQDLYWVNVVEQRPLSNWIAEQLQVTHQSPQLIKVQGGKAVDSWSHGTIKRGLLEGGE